MPRKFCYDYPRPAVTVDIAVFARAPEGFRLLLIRRKKDPYAGCWAFPGGFVEIEERFEDAARRELAEETGLALEAPLDFLGVWGEPGRDPRGRTISMVYAVALTEIPGPIEGRDDASEAAWLDPLEVDALAFDHDDILSASRQWLQHALTGRGGLAFLPKVFSRADVNWLFRALHVEPRYRTLRIEAFLEGFAEPLPDNKARYRAKSRSRGQSVKGTGRPRKGSRSPSHGG